MSDRATILRRATPIFHEVLRPDLAVTEIVGVLVMVGTFLE